MYLSYIPAYRRALSHFFPKPQRVLFDFLLDGEGLALVQLTPHCHPVRGPAPYQLLYKIRSPEPWLCCMAEELLTPMDFSFVDLTESMFCFCLPRPGPWISISFHHSSSLVSLGVCVRVNLCVFTSFPFSINFPNPVCSLETTSSVALSSSSSP